MKQMAVKIAEHGQTVLQHRTVHNMNRKLFHAVSIQYIYTVRWRNCKAEIQMYLVCFTTSITIFLTYDHVFYYVTRKLLIIIDVKVTIP